MNYFYLNTEAGRAEELPFATEEFDALTFTYLLRYVEDPEATLAELARVVRPGGRVANLEFFRPPRVLLRAAWWCYTRGVLPVAGFLTGGRAWFEVGRFLGPNITGHYRRYPLDWTLEAWRRAGFEEVAALAVTGYGKDLLKDVIGADLGIVETVAHATAALANERLAQIEMTTRNPNTNDFPIASLISVLVAGSRPAGTCKPASLISPARRSCRTPGGSEN